MANKMQHGTLHGHGYLDKVVEVQFQALRSDIGELRKRVGRLETVLGRGVMLLVGNLLGVLVTLIYQLI